MQSLYHSICLVDLLLQVCDTVVKDWVRSQRLNKAITHCGVGIDVLDLDLVLLDLPFDDIQPVLECGLDSIDPLIRLSADIAQVSKPLLRLILYFHHCIVFELDH